MRSGDACEPASSPSMPRPCSRCLTRISARLGCRAARSPRCARSPQAIDGWPRSSSMPSQRRLKRSIHAELTALKGIGPWTADIYIMFSLARADAWSPGDLALQHAVKDALLLAERPSLVRDERGCRSLASLARRRRAAAVVLLRAAPQGDARVPTRFISARSLRGSHGNRRSPLATSEPDMPREA